MGHFDDPRRQAIERNPWITAPLVAAGDAIERPELPGADCPGPFRFADRDATAAVLIEAGFTGVEIDPLELDLEMRGSPAEILGFFSEIGPLSRAIEPLDGEVREAVLARVLADFERRHDGEAVAMGAAMWVVTARR